MSFLTCLLACLFVHVSWWQISNQSHKKNSNLTSQNHIVINMIIWNIVYVNIATERLFKNMELLNNFCHSFVHYTVYWCCEEAYLSVQCKFIYLWMCLCVLQNSLCNDPLIELSNPGASGSLFYVSSDDEFIIKTVQHKEAEFLQKLLPGYFMVRKMCVWLMFFC